MQNNTKERTSKAFDYLIIARKIDLICFFFNRRNTSHRWFSSLIEKWITINCFHCFCFGNWFFKWKFSSELFFFLRRIVQKSRNDYITLNASRNVINGAPHTHAYWHIRCAHIQTDDGYDTVSALSHTFTKTTVKQRRIESAFQPFHTLCGSLGELCPRQLRNFSIFFSKHRQITITNYL